MKKARVLIIVMVIACLVGCGKTAEETTYVDDTQQNQAKNIENTGISEVESKNNEDEVITEATAEDSEEETPGSKEEIEETYIVEANEAFSISIPADWEGKYSPTINSREIYLYIKNEYGKKCLFGFDLHLEMYEKDSNVGRVIATMLNPEGTTYYLSVINYDEPGVDETYYELKADMYDVVASLTASEGWTLEFNIGIAPADYVGDEFEESNGVFTAYLPYMWDSIYRIDSSEKHFNIYVLDSSGEYFLFGFKMSTDELNENDVKKIAVMTDENGTEYGLYLHEGEKPEAANDYVYNAMKSAMYQVATSLVPEDNWTVNYLGL